MAMNFEISAAQTNRLFTHCLEQLEAHPRWAASPQLSHAQNMLMAYLRMDKIAEEEGFAALIAQGWGEMVLDGALAERYRIKDISRFSVPEDFRNRKIHQCWEIGHL